MKGWKGKGAKGTSHGKRTLEWVRKEERKERVLLISHYSRPVIIKGSYI